MAVAVVGDIDDTTESQMVRRGGGEGGDGMTCVLLCDLSPMVFIGVYLSQNIISFLQRQNAQFDEAIEEANAVRTGLEGTR